MSHREEIKSLLKECTNGQQMMFKRMYSSKDLGKSIDQVVNDMPEDKLKHALFQCENSVKKNKRKKIESDNEPKSPTSMKEKVKLLEETVGNALETKNRAKAIDDNKYKLKTKLNFD